MRLLSECRVFVYDVRMDDEMMLFSECHVFVYEVNMI